jgi:hypothetical protein
MHRQPNYYIDVQEVATNAYAVCAMFESIVETFKNESQRGSWKV